MYCLMTVVKTYFVLLYYQPKNPGLLTTNVNNLVFNKWYVTNLTPCFIAVYQLEYQANEL